MKTNWIIGMVCLLYGLLCYPAQAADALDTWHWRNPVVQNAPLNGVCDANGKFVAVGRSGAILTSPDGINWLSQSSGTELELRCVCYGDGLFVAAGDYGVILTSPDGKTWTDHSPTWFYHLLSITYGNGKFVAVGDNSTILVSVNGVDWSLAASGSDKLTSIAYGNGLFVAVGGISSTPSDYSSYGISLILVSSDGIQWKRHTSLHAAILYSITFGQGQFIAAGNSVSDSSLMVVMSSVYGEKWEPVMRAYIGSSKKAYLCAHLDRFYVICGYLYSYYSSIDGYNWTIETESTPLPISSGNIRSIASDGATQVIVGYDYLGVAIISRDKSHDWEDMVQKSLIGFNHMTFLGGKFLGLVDIVLSDWNPSGASTAAMSPDGVSWAEYTVFTNSWVAALAYDHGLYVAVGLNGAVATSPDAQHWTDQQSGVTNHLTSVAAGAGLFVATGPDGVLCKSPDGTNWSQQMLPDAPPLSSLVYGNGTFAMIDNHDQSLLLSPDGMTWSRHTGKSNFASIRFDSGMFLSVLSDGKAVASTNALDWFLLYESSNGKGLTDLCYSDGFYAAIKVEWFQQNSQLLTSVDGKNWKIQLIPGLSYVNTVAVGNNSVVVGSDWKNILQSDPLTNSSPSIAIPPRPMAVMSGQSVSLTATALGTSPLDFTWLRDGILMPGANDSILVLTNLANGESHQFTLIVSNALGVVSNAPVHVVAGEPARLALRATPQLKLSLYGTSNLAYQVEYLESLAPSSVWHLLTNISMPINGELILENTAITATNRFFRAQLIP